MKDQTMAFLDILKDDPPYHKLARDHFVHCIETGIYQLFFLHTYSYSYINIIDKCWYFPASILGYYKYDMTQS